MVTYTFEILWFCAGKTLLILMFEKLKLFYLMVQCDVIDVEMEVYLIV